MVNRRTYLEASASGPVTLILRNLGFKRDFDFVAEGREWVRGRVKILLYALYEAQSVSAAGADPSGTDRRNTMQSTDFGTPMVG